MSKLRDRIHDGPKLGATSTLGQNLELPPENASIFFTLPKNAKIIIKLSILAFIAILCFSFVILSLLLSEFDVFN